MAETKNYRAIRYGNQNGEVKFGHVHQDETLSAAMLRSGTDPLHYITLDSTGDDTRKNSTICRSKGSFQVKAADDVIKGKVGIYLDSVNGDIVLRAPNGRIRLEAVNIDMKATGENDENGNITIEGNSKVIINAPTIDVNSSVSSKFFSENTVELIGRSILNIYGGMIDVADGATAVKGSKVISSNEIKNRQ